jgi:putative glutamine amidotransferase
MTPDRDRPLVGVLGNTETLDGVPHQAVRDVYLRAVVEVAGCVAVLLPGPSAGEFASVLLDRLDGVVLTGHQSNVGAGDPDRDSAALAIIPAAVGRGLPLLGVCRGLQEMNVAYGGTLRAVAGHREDESRPRAEQYLPRHSVSVTGSGALHRILGATEVRVNSLHGQAIDVLADGLLVEAVAADGVIEAVSVAGSSAFALGVQWHPEWYAATDPVCRRIFAAFGSACHAGRLATARGSTA